jgi:hypothetical protein
MASLERHDTASRSIGAEDVEQSQDVISPLEEQQDRLLPIHDDRHAAVKNPSIDNHSQATSASQDGKREKPDEVPSRELERFSLILFATLIYAVVALLAWVITCILVHRPINAQRYGQQPGVFSDFPQELT